MNVVTDKEALRQARAALAGTVALVPTMGALHEGHRALLRSAHEHADHVVVSVFVNPLQFGAAEDLDDYPRSLDADLAMCEGEGAALVFTPAAGVMYPQPPQVTVHAGALGDVYEGAARPGHFDGVLTVVAKLLHLATPDVAVFGAKDAQQLALVRRMVADLDLPVVIHAVPTVRDTDGLALSSRNVYLSADDRNAAAAIPRALVGGAATANPAANAVSSSAGALGLAPGVDPEYLALVDPDTFEDWPLGRAGTAIMIVAARVGGTRLIDNVPVHVPGAGR